MFISALFSVPSRKGQPNPPKKKQPQITTNKPFLEKFILYIHVHVCVIENKNWLGVNEKKEEAWRNSMPCVGKLIKASDSLGNS